MSDFNEILRAAREDEWSFGQYTARHHRSNLEVWIANGVSFVDFYPVKAGFGMIEKWRLWRALKAARRAQIMRQFSVTPTHMTHADEAREVEKR